jgi:phosphopantetheine adenylyltransferase
MVKEVAFYGGDISNMIPLKANQMLFSKLKKRS